MANLASFYDKVDQLSKRANRIAHYKDFHGTVEQWKVRDHFGELVLQHSDPEVLKMALMNPDQDHPISIFRCSTNNEIYIPPHNHSVIEYIVVNEGEMYIAELNQTLGKNEHAFIKAFQPHSVYIEDRCDFNVIFVPYLPYEVVDV